METILVYALYVWVIVSVVALIIQLIRRVVYNRSRAKQDKAAAATSEAPVVDLRSTDAETVSENTSNAPTDAIAEKAKTSVFASAPAASATGAEPALATDIDNDDQPATGSTPPATEPAEAAEQAEAAEPAAAPARTLADVLEGVRLPWDLLPVVDQGQPATDQRLSLVTNSAAPGEVGGAVADELERLGFTVVADADDRAVATRDNDVLGLRIIPEAAGDTIDGVLRFPEAAETTVALDIWLED